MMIQLLNYYKQNRTFDNKYYKEALTFIEQHDLASMPVGRIDINGNNLWLNIVECSLKSLSEAKLEAHNKYIDLQIPLSSSEQYGIKERNLCTQPIGKFDTNQDIVFYKDEIDVVKTLNPGDMIVFMPNTAHAPLIGEGTIKKAISKVINI